MFTLPVVILYLRDDFTVLNYTNSGILWTGLIVTNTVLSIFVGFFADTHRKSRYPVIYVGLIIMITGWFIIPMATQYYQLIIIFIFIGFGAAAFHPTAFLMITQMFEGNKGRALSIKNKVIREEHCQ